MSDKRKPPRVVTDILARVPGYAFSVILDVGANTGQSCIPLAAALPDARIYSFEPVRGTFDTLARNIAPHPSIQAFNFALGDRDGTARMSAAANSPANRLTAMADDPEGETVGIVTGRSFREREGLGRISLLKVDTEGHDLDVVRGFGDDLMEVDFVQVEAGMNAYNRTHVPFRAFLDFFDVVGFPLFHLYNQVFEFKQGGRPVARRSNPVFINPRLAGDLSGIQ